VRAEIKEESIAAGETEDEVFAKKGGGELDRIVGRWRR
jgi:hypothetical protein